MFAISIDIEVTQKQMEDLHDVLGRFGFFPAIGGMFLSESKDMVGLFLAINELKAIPWFAEKVQEVKAFRVENMSDFTEIIKRG